MLYAFRNGAGITLPRVSKHQATVGTYVSRQNLRPGDLYSGVDQYTTLLCI
ncbi:hypothetical protein [Peptostreptococcus anaerobius]|uniref:hypothetical protein n=1 Tax=Peptostreptococcus anaerobius TaxID=1261 RepID=UPI001FA921F0|nr:hypothetical protein [Peptostreptococcus anaerobius]